MSRLFLQCVCVFVVGWLVRIPAWSQPADGSIEQLRLEVDRLVKRNEELTSRLSDQTRQIDRLATEKRDLAAQVDKLMTEAADLRTRLASKPAGSATPVRETVKRPPAERLAPIPEDPLASPASMLVGLKKIHGEGFANWGHETAAEAKRYAVAAEDWCERLPRIWRGERTWLVDLNDWRREAFGPSSVLVRVIDPATGLPIGEAFRQEIPTKFIDRLDRHERMVAEGHAPASLWNARVKVTARPRFNAERVEIGPYNEPPFVGHQVEFGYELEWRSLYLDKPGEVAPKPSAPATPATRGKP